MKIENFYNEWTLEIKSGRPNKDGWRAVKVYRQPKGYHRVKTKSGHFCMVPNGMNVFSLRWNGKQFAEGVEPKSLQKKFSELYARVLDFMQKRLLPPPSPLPLAWVKEKFPELHLVFDLGEWALFLKSADEEWNNYVLVRKIKLKKGEGGNILHFGHNGERFARAATIAHFQALHPNLFVKIQEYLHATR